MFVIDRWEAVRRTKVCGSAKYLYDKKYRRERPSERRKIKKIFKFTNFLKSFWESLKTLFSKRVFKKKQNHQHRSKNDLQTHFG